MSVFSIFNPFNIGYAYGITLYANKTDIINKTTYCSVSTIINCLAVGTLCGGIADIFSKCLSLNGENITIRISLFLLFGKELYKLYKSINLR